MLTAIDIEVLTQRARDLWLRLTSRRGSRVELYAKQSDRVRVERAQYGPGSSIHRANETGLAVRTFTNGDRRAGFAACAGLSSAAADRAVDESRAWPVDASTPPPTDDIPDVRSDLDDELTLPTETELRRWIDVDPSITWIEFGTTNEVLIGPTAWIARRRRHRIWAMTRAGGPSFLGARAVPKWDAALMQLLADSPGTSAGTSWSSDQPLVLLPRAAAPIVLALVHRFHLQAPESGRKAGIGWELRDEPRLPGGLVGGDFDDAGFATHPLELARGGSLRGCLGTRPGHHWRKSYREPPIPGPSNVVMSSLDSEARDVSSLLVERSRVIPLSSQIWVLELATSAGESAYARSTPEALLEGCRSRVGPVRATADGPVLPSLLFEGIQTASSSSA